MAGNIQATINGIDKIIADLCLTAYKRVNSSAVRANPNRRNKPYSVPKDAIDLIALKKDLMAGAKTEAEAKSIMMRIRKDNQ